MNFLSLGDPANGTAPFTLPGRQVAGNIVRCINKSSSDIQLFFPGNTLQIVVPSRAIRRIQLTAPEQRQVTWSVLSVDPTFVGTSHTWIEVYSPSECDHPFEQSPSIGAGGAINTLVLNLGQEYHWNTGGTPTDPGYIFPFQGGLGYPVVQIAAPAPGLYLLESSICIRDSNTVGVGVGADKPQLSWQIGPSYGGNQGLGQNVYSGGGTTLTPADGLNQFNGNTDGWAQMPFLVGQVQGEQMILWLSLAGSGYATPPIIQTYATITLLAAG